MIAFINAFLSYLLLFFVFCLVAGAAVFVGISMRKKKNKADCETAGKQE